MTGGRFHSDEMEQLMDRVQELLEARVLAMIFRHPTGRISLVVPPAHRAEVIAFLQTRDWSKET